MTSELFIFAQPASNMASDTLKTLKAQEFIYAWVLWRWKAEKVAFAATVNSTVELISLEVEILVPREMGGGKTGSVYTCSLKAGALVLIFKHK